MNTEELVRDALHNADVDARDVLSRLRESLADELEGVATVSTVAGTHKPRPARFMLAAIAAIMVIAVGVAGAVQLRSANTHQPLPQAKPPTSNPAYARWLAQQLMSKAVLPPGAVPANPHRPGSAVFRSPKAKQLVTESRTWQVPTTLRAAESFLKRHPGAGLTPGAWGGSSAIGGRAVAVSFAEMDPSPGESIDSAGLSFTVFRVATHVADIEVDATVSWLQPRGVLEHIPARDQVVILSTTNKRVVVTSQGTVAKLIRTFEQSKVAPPIDPGPHSCPERIIERDFTLAFATSASSPPDRVVAVRFNNCFGAYADVSVNAHSAGPTLDGYALYELVGKMI
jgi:hypothetical protein